MLALREDYNEAEFAREDEPFVTGRIGEAALLREVFLDALDRDAHGGDAVEFEPIYDARFESRARRGLTPVGLFAEAERRRHLTLLTAWRDSARRGELLNHGPFCVYRFGRAAEGERIDRLERVIPIDVPLTNGSDGPRTVRVELFGRTEIQLPELPASIALVVRDKARDSDFLAGFLDAVILSLVPGRAEPSAYHAHVVTTDNKGDSPTYRRTFRGIDENRARTFLTDLLADLLTGPHAYLLPCEAVFHRMSEEKNSIESSVNSMKENDNELCSSRYGPVPHFEQYDAPDDDSAQKIIDRRFGLFRDSGGMG